MKKLLLSSMVLGVFAVSCLVFQMVSCKKAQAQAAATYPVQGLWVGTYTADGQPGLGEQYFSFIIKPDGTLINDTKFLNQQHLSLGNWSLNGNILSCTFTNVYGIAQNVGTPQTSTATWDNKGKLTSGIWRNTGSTAGSGTFTLARVN
jgi:hypothetical protein